MSKSLFDRSQGKLFKPRFSRNNKESSNYLSSQNDLYLDNSEFKNTNLESTSSFRYGDKPYLVSTQQLKIDWSRYENHTFFHSAVANVNESFDRIVNFYPFEKSQKSIEEFEDGLTGFEKYILDSFPKNVGYLNFSGTVKGESSSNGTQIIVKDRRGSSIESISDRVDGAPVLDPNQSPFSLEFFIKLPEKVNDNQIIVQKFSSLSNNFTLAISASSDTSECNINFGISSGSNYLFVTGALSKNEFNHVTAFYDRLGDQRAKLLINDTVLSSSNAKLFNTLNYEASDFKIGTGVAARMNGLVFTPQETLSGSIDDFRYFHSVDTIKTIKKRKYRSYYPHEGDPTLKLYYRFNEPYGSYGGNDIVLDSSGNSLHERIVNFEVSNRLTSSDVPVLSENINRNPVLFPTFQPSIDLNTDLLTTASLYDEYNPNLITNLIPKHYFQEGTNFREFSEEFDKLGTGFNALSKNSPGSGVSDLPDSQMLIKLLLTYAKFFDELKLMIDGITSYQATEYDEYDTTPDVFLKEKAKITNTTLPYMFSTGDISQLLLGIDLADSKAKSARSLNEIQNLIWRRILSEAPKMKLHKGTVRSIKSAFRNAGIEPDNILTFREYGGSKQKSLDASRILKKDVYRFLNFSSSYGKTTTGVDAQGYPTDSAIPRLKSGFLSGSRIQAGSPPAAGTFVQKSLYKPHGISNDASDGLFTSGSFTYEALYRFEDGYRDEKQSLVRMHITGSTLPTNKEAVLSNLVADDTNVSLYLREQPLSGMETTRLYLTGLNIYDRDTWYVSFGRKAGYEIEGAYRKYELFLRAAKQVNGDLVENYATSSFVHYDNIAGDFFSVQNSTFNASGSFIVIGSQSFQGGAANTFLNGNTSNVPDDAKITNFSGMLANARFFSKNTTYEEYLNRAKNYDSYGVKNPSVNHSFVDEITGSFERVILRTDAKQATQESDSNGNIRLFDFSQNELHLEGSNFPTSQNVMKNVRVDFESLSDNFDLNYSRDKVRVRSFQDASNLEQGYFSTIAPVHEVLPSEESVDDNRLSLDMSVMKGFNANALKMFNDFSALDDALGSPNILFGESYGDLRHLREVYFNNVIEVMDLQKYRDLFKWIDNSFTDVVFSLVPRTTNFLGINFIYESHILERNRFKYLYDEIYMKANQRDGSRGNIFLSQFVGRGKKY